ELLLEFDTVAAASDAVPEYCCSSTDSTDCDRPQDRVFVGRIGASSKFLEISLAVAIKVGRAVSRQITKVGNLPIIVHAIAVGVARTKSDQKHVALIVVVACDEIASEALESRSSSIA